MKEESQPQERTEMSGEQKIGVLGVGNLLLSDEGFGIHLLRYLEEQYEVPERVTLLDGGTAGIYMAPFLEECERVVVLDVTAKQLAPGTFHCFTLDEVKSANQGLRLSPHQFGLLEVLELCQFRGTAPREVYFITVAPASLETGLELTPHLAASLPEAARLLIECLASWGCPLRKTAHA
ncbi:MAG: HyaD/HybD family hydrogenase maturation endopeptidase [Thermodesulfobacteriota bacterium]